MTGENEESKDSMEALSWPDTSRPVIGQQPSAGPQQGGGYGAPQGGYGQQPANPWPSDPVIFGSPPFGPPPQVDEPARAPRPTWAIIVGILVVVVVLVGAVGIWVL